MWKKWSRNANWNWITRNQTLSIFFNKPFSPHTHTSSHLNRDEIGSNLSVPSLGSTQEWHIFCSGYTQELNIGMYTLLSWVEYMSGYSTRSIEWILTQGEIFLAKSFMSLVRWHSWWRSCRSGSPSWCSVIYNWHGDIYIGAIKVLGNATPPRVLVLEGWKLNTDPAQYSRWPLVKIIWIGPRVPGLGPNLGQILNKITITRYHEDRLFLTLPAKF